VCGECAEVCQYNALAILGGEVRVFPELCHGCGSCTLICPEEAIDEVPRVLGGLEGGRSGQIRFGHGILNVGEAMAVPVIHDLKEWAKPEADQVTILDAPPGTSCPMVESVVGSDFVLLVTEPTPFGLHDLDLAVEAIRELGIPMGVVINRDGIGDQAVDEFCAAESLPVLLRIPFRREIAEELARGGTLLDVRPEYGDLLRLVVEQVTAMGSQVEGGGATGAGGGWPGKNEDS
jgi:MinD superfamily P-loop ATPase